jgi:hypothetical protein
MAGMVRKQVYIEKRQDEALKRAARRRGVTEAQLVREALDLRSRDSRAGMAPDRQAWLSFKRFVLRGRKQGPLAARARTWTRDELYEERIGRWTRS